MSCGSERTTHVKIVGNIDTLYILQFYSNIIKPCDKEITSLLCISISIILKKVLVNWDNFSYDKMSFLQLRLLYITKYL